jgi:hypothetical protein
VNFEEKFVASQVCLRIEKRVENIEVRMLKKESFIIQKQGVN